MSKIYIVNKNTGAFAYYGTQGDKVSLESNTTDYAIINAAENPQPSPDHIWDFETASWVLPE